MPKYIFPLEKSCFAFLNMCFSLIALVMVMVITGAPMHLSVIGVVIPMFFEFIFIVGAGLFLSATAIYFRDIMHFWTIIVTALTYATPIFYPETIWQGTILQYVGKLNPMYWYVTTFRGCIIDGVFPSLKATAICAFFAVVMLAIGAKTFQKLQDNFILYI